MDGYNSTDELAEGLTPVRQLRHLHRYYKKGTLSPWLEAYKKGLLPVHNPDFFGISTLQLLRDWQGLRSAQMTSLQPAAHKGIVDECQLYSDELKARSVNYRYRAGMLEFPQTFDHNKPWMPVGEMQQEQKGPEEEKEQDQKEKEGWGGGGGGAEAGEEGSTGEEKQGSREKHNVNRKRKRCNRNK
jgi:hypothetical protein